MANTSSIPHPLFKDKNIRLPAAGKLKWLGGNLGLGFPIGEHVVDDKGNFSVLSLSELLERLDDFEGYRGNVPIAQNLLDCCFTAYEFAQMTVEEKAHFENYVSERVKELNT